LKRSENNGKYTELAVKILSEQPRENSQNIRNWAVDIIKNYSGVDIDKNTRTEMIKTGVVIWDDISPGYVDPVIGINERAVEIRLQDFSTDGLSDYFLSNGHIAHADDGWYRIFFSRSRTREHHLGWGWNIIRFHRDLH